MTRSCLCLLLALSFSLPAYAEARPAPASNAQADSPDGKSLAPAPAVPEPESGPAALVPEPKPEPVPQYLIDVLVFARNSVDTSAEHWDSDAPTASSILHLFFPDLSGTGGATASGFNHVQREVWFGPDKSLATGRFSTPIDRVRSKLASLNSEALLRRQWVFNDFGIADSPKIRLNDFQVWLPRLAPSALPAPVPAAAAPGAPPPPSAQMPLHDLPRCRQDSRRRLRLNLWPEAAVADPRGADELLYTRSDARAMFGDSGGGDSGGNTPAEDTAEAGGTAPPDAPAVSVEDSVQLALFSPGSVALESSAPVLEEIDLSGVSANRIDGHIKLFLSRHHHIELHLQYLRPFMTSSEARPGRVRSSGPQPCLLAFTIEEGRRLKKGEIHYFDHPAFAAVLFFTELEPEIETESGAAPALENDNRIAPGN